ncbi:hypothetical protein F5883DRAFT_558800 [Diaporthe sp. PMI_573]|nr:hypothetical protein F5883DRAFT_558800 [Diaporthaceae sp. PMI_573]
MARSLTHPNFSDASISIYALQPTDAEQYCRRQPVALQNAHKSFSDESCRSQSSGRGCSTPSQPITGSAKDQPTRTKMAKKGGGAGENSKKAAGQARKAEAAANKKAGEDSKKAAAEDAEWAKGSKKANAKKEDEAAKKVELARKKAEREALLAEEERNTPGRSAPKNAKSAQKKTRGIDAALGGLDLGGDGKLATLNASGLDNALDALDITSTDNKVKIDRHPERRVKAAFTVWKEARMVQLTEEGYFKIKGNKRSKVEDDLWDEFQTSPENPKNQVHGSYDMTQEEIEEIREQEKSKIEQRLAEI